MSFKNEGKIDQSENTKAEIKKNTSTHSSCNHAKAPKELKARISGITEQCKAHANDAMMPQISAFMPINLFNGVVLCVQI